MKKILLMILIVLLPNLVSAVEIHQIYYDPITSESGGEAIEFFNPHPFDVDISSWIIATESSMQDAIIPANTTIKANSYFLVADNMWDERKDNPNWRDADFMTPITLNNENSGIALLNSSNGLVDAVGWGDTLEISNNLFSGTPATDAEQGKALKRIDSTDDNLNDFIITEPDFYGDNIIQAEINITSSIQSSAYILEGSCITPNAGTNTTIHVRAGELVSATLFDTTKTLEKLDNITYETRFTIPFYQAPGNYSIFFSDNTELRVEIKEIKSFKVISEKIKFNVIPGTSTIAENKAIVQNKGNTNLMFTLTILNDNSIFNSLFQYSLNKEEFIPFADTFELAAGKSSDLFFKIEIPEETEIGSYQSLIAISAE